MPYFNIVAQTSENTVVTEYEPVKARSDSYQSESELEQEFIRLLCEQGYEYLTIHTEADLISNLRKKLEELNGYQFTDAEWKRFFSDCIANANDGIAEKTRKIQEDNVQVLKRDDGSSKNITLIDKKNIHNNRLQVINQYVMLDRFTYIFDDKGNLVRTITKNLPVTPYTDVFKKMKDSSSTYMTTFYNRLSKAVDNLTNAVNVESAHDAGKYVQKVLGDGFTVPAKEAVAAAAQNRREHSFG